jgi:hypothetical protein
MKFTTALIILILGSHHLNSQIFRKIDFNTEKDIEVSLRFTSHSAGSFIDTSGNTVTFMTNDNYGVDSLGRQYSADYTFDRTITRITPAIRYKPLEKLYLSLEIPLAFHGLKEQYTTYAYTTDTTQEIIRIATNRNYKSDLSLAQIEYFGLGGRYNFTEDGLISYAAAEIRIPSGFDESIIDDPGFDFLSDGALEIIGGAGFDIDEEKFSFGIDAFYNLRGEELEDRFIFNTELAIKTVENTRLYGIYRHVAGLKSMDDTEQFTTDETILNENYGDVAAGFYIRFDNEIFFDLRYTARIWGENTWNYAGYYISLGVNL